MTIGLLLVAFLTPPFGVRAYLDARAQTASDSSRMAFSVTRPAGSVSKLPATAFATSTPAPLDGIRGKGAWFMIFNGDWTDADADRARALVDSAVSADLSHIYVRVADSRRHFYGAPALQDLLPIAHAHHLRVIGWIEPMLNDPTQDAADDDPPACFQQTQAVADIAFGRGDSAHQLWVTTRDHPACALLIPQQPGQYLLLEV